ncbi:MAG TPA: 1,2-phenylacetyl-CoA epoxidase subunit PaaD [Candidatus Limnocylindrales bacterium]|nr:1,2-phenylacetyl-CoA epoxidase subunit PaaD [Candidatus Limnocylindrales bacterium]
MVTEPLAPPRAAGADEAAIWAALGDVHDPEIPTISIVDLGVVRSVELSAAAVRIELLPTFVGCPAIELIVAGVRDRVATLVPDRPVEVEISFAEPWTTERITPEGRDALRRSGFAPPLPASPPGAPIALTGAVPCPFCGSRRTVLENPFGPTACRSIRYCTDCRQPFEQFKTV